MEIRFEQSAADLAAFQRYMLRHANQQNRRGGRLGGIAFMVVVLALAIVFLEELASFNILGFLKQAIILLLGLAVLVFVWHRIFFRRAAKSLSGELVIRFAEDGLHHDDPVTKAFTAWPGLDHIGLTSDYLFLFFGYARGLAIPRRAFPDEAAFEAALAALRRHRPDLDVESPPQVAQKARRHRRGLAVAAVLVALAAALALTTPWRERLALPDDQGEVSYLVAHGGGAQPGERLPLILDLHPLAGFPEIMTVAGHNQDFPARIVYPAAPYWHLVGLSWFGFDHHMAEEARAAADQLAAFTAALIGRYPTAGQPIVTGFSQGGSMAYALAAFHPELFAASVPVSGALPAELPAREGVPYIVVRALHGGDDQIVPADWARYAIEAMEEQGWDVELEVYPEAGHKLPAEAKAQWRKLLADFAAAEGGS